MTALVLDARALEVVADRRADPVGARRIQALLTAAARSGVPVRVPVPVLAESLRGTRADAGIERVLGHGIRPVTAGLAMARLAGSMLHRDRLGSCHAVDAFVVAAAVRLGGGIVATGDPDDIKRLAREHRNVEVVPVGAER